VDARVANIVVDALSAAGYRVIVDADAEELGEHPDEKVVVLSMNQDCSAHDDGQLQCHRDTQERPTLPVHTIHDESLQGIATAWVSCGLDPEALRAILSSPVDCVGCGACESYEPEAAGQRSCRRAFPGDDR